MNTDKKLRDMLRIGPFYGNRYINTAQQVADYHGVSLKDVLKGRKNPISPSILDKAMRFDEMVEMVKDRKYHDIFGVQKRGCVHGVKRTVINALNKNMRDDGKTRYFVELEKDEKNCFDKKKPREKLRDMLETGPFSGNRYINTAQQVADHHGVSLKDVLKGREDPISPNILDKAMRFDQIIKAAEDRNDIGLTVIFGALKHGCVHGVKRAVIVALNENMRDDGKTRYFVRFEEDENKYL